MSILVVGGDRLGKIPAKLKDAGFTEIKHFTGRKKGHLTVDIPHQVDIILVFVDYVSHGLAVKVKEKARERGIRTVFARRAWSHIYRALALEAGPQLTCQ
jgi:hypothetical protein